MVTLVAPWAWKRGLWTWVVFCGKAHFAATLRLFTVPFRVLWVLNSFWIFDASLKSLNSFWRVCIFFRFLQFFRVKNIKKILAGPDSKTDPHFLYPYIFSYHRVKIWLETQRSLRYAPRLGHAACRLGLFFCRKAHFATTLRLFTMPFCILWVLNSFWGLWCPSEKFELIPTSLHIFFSISQFPRVKNIKNYLRCLIRKLTHISRILTFFPTTVQKSSSKRDDYSGTHQGLAMRPADVGCFLRKILNKYMKAQN